MLNAKGVITFKDLLLPEYQDDARYRFKLRVIASDLSGHCMLVLPQDVAEFGANTEDLEVALAVRMSMSIPFFYEPMTIKDRKTGLTHYIVDGGILSNIPVWLFDSEGVEGSWPTFGFKLVEPGIESGYCNIHGPISLLSALFSTMMEAHDARYIKDKNFARTIPIPTMGVGTTDFNLPKEKSEALYQSGRQAAEKFFDTWDYETYIRKFGPRAGESHRGEELRSDS